MGSDKQHNLIPTSPLRTAGISHRTQPGHTLLARARGMLWYGEAPYNTPWSVGDSCISSRKRAKVERSSRGKIGRWGERSKGNEIVRQGVGIGAAEETVECLGYVRYAILACRFDDVGFESVGSY